MKNKKLNLCGGITVFISLILLSIIVFVLILIESVRLHTGKNRIDEISYISLNSCFSKFAREVFEDYGIYILYDDEKKIVDDYSNFVCNNINYNIDNNVNIYDFKLSDIRVKNIKYITQDNGLLFFDQVSRYMKYKIGEDIISGLVDKCKSFGNSEYINSLFDKVNKCSSQLTKIEDSVAKIKDSVNKLYDVNYEPISNLTYMKNKFSEIQVITSKYTSYECMPESDLCKIRDLYSEYLDYYDKYKNGTSIVNTELKNMISDAQEYYTNVERSKTKLDELTTSIGEFKNKVDSSVYESAEDEVNQLSDRISDMNLDLYGVKRNDELVNEFYSEFSKSQNIVNDDNSQIDKLIIDKIDVTSLEYSFVDKYIENLDNAALQYKNFNLQELYINYNPKEICKSESSIIDYVESLISNGVLGIVTSNKPISNKNIDLCRLPSTNCTSGKSNSIDNEINKVILGQYIINCFDTYTTTKNTKPLDYEIEYVVGGFNSDKKNLDEVVSKILLIREGFNLAYLFTDVEKKEQALLLATSIVGFTGMPILIKLTQFVVLSSWAYAESIIDVKDLLNNKKVSLLKTKDEWTLSIEGIRNIDNEESKNNQLGLDYGDYLRFLLFRQSMSKLLYRTMDLIQLNIQNSYNNDFIMEKGIVQIDINSVFSIGGLFSSDSFINDYTDNITDFYQINTNQIISY